MTLEELRDALAKATGPDWQLNSGIARLALGWKWRNENGLRGGDYKPAGWYTPDNKWHHDTPNWTASIDAAVTLVPEGMSWLRKTERVMTVVMPPSGEKEWGIHYDATGATPALALCKARIEYEIAQNSTAGDPRGKAQ